MTALVTGASSGIGRAIAVELAQRGYDLAVTARRLDRLDELATEVRKLGRACQTVAADLAEPGAAGKLWAALGGAVPDFVVANAGFGTFGPFAATDPARIDALNQVNVVALTQLVRLALPGMLARNSGRVLTVASVASYLPGPGMAAYYASKAYVRSLSEALSHEVRASKVTVTCLCPGPVKTGFAEAAAIGEAPLFDGPGVMTAGAVAKIAVDAALAGRRVVVPGASNRLLTFGTRLLPTGALLRMVDYVQKNKRPEPAK